MSLSDLGYSQVRDKSLTHRPLCFAERLSIYDGMYTLRRCPSTRNGVLYKIESREDLLFRFGSSRAGERFIIERLISLSGSGGSQLLENSL